MNFARPGSGWEKEQYTTVIEKRRMLVNHEQRGRRFGNFVFNTLRPYLGGNVLIRGAARKSFDCREDLNAADVEII